MKLLFCPKCYDVFKLDYELRSCRCGFCKGKYEDHLNAITNGKGICLAIANPDLDDARKFLLKGRDVFIVRCWARQHEGINNPHTKIKEDLY